MIKFLVEDTHPTYRVKFIYWGDPMSSLLHGRVQMERVVNDVPEDEIDEVVLGFLPAEPKEQVFEWPE